MILPKPQYKPNPGESPGQFIARIVMDYVGCSLSQNRQKLAALVGRGVDDESIVGIKTNCATFALSTLYAAGCPHTLLAEPYKIGMAFAWLDQIGRDLGAWMPFAGTLPPVGAVCHYAIGGTGDDHAEFVLDQSGLHGGGGRSQNAITISTDHPPLAYNWGRPMVRYLDPSKLSLPDTITAIADPLIQNK